MKRAVPPHTSTKIALKLEKSAVSDHHPRLWLPFGACSGRGRRLLRGGGGRVCAWRVPSHGLSRPGPENARTKKKKKTADRDASLCTQTPQENKTKRILMFAHVMSVSGHVICPSLIWHLVFYFSRQQRASAKRINYMFFFFFKSRLVLVERETVFEKFVSNRMHFLLIVSKSKKLKSFVLVGLQHAHLYESVLTWLWGKKVLADFFS